MLEQCCNYSKQGRINAVALCWAKNRRFESSRVTLTLNVMLNLSDFLFLFLNLDTVLYNSIPEKFANLDKLHEVE